MEDDAELGGVQNVSFSMPAQEELASSTYKSCDEHLGKLNIHAGGILSESVHGDLAGEKCRTRGKSRLGKLLGAAGLKMRHGRRAGGCWSFSKPKTSGFFFDDGRKLWDMWQRGRGGGRGSCPLVWLLSLLGRNGQER